MARSDRTLASAAKLFVLLEERRTLCDRMRSIVEPLQRSRLVIADGESDLLENLSRRLETALGLLRRYGAQDEAVDAPRLLDELAQQVDCDDWALGQEMYDQLERKALQEADIVRGFQSAIDQWTTRVAGLKKELDAALLVHAPVRRETDRHQSLEALVRSGQTAITDRAYSTLPEVLAKLEAEQAAANVDDAAAAVRTKRDEARRFSRIAELLLLQSPLDQKRRYHYTVLLRMPGERGHGVNVQASTTLVENDRKSMTDALGRVTHAIEHGLERVRKGVSPAEPPPQPPVAAPGPQPSEHDRIRRALWDTDADPKDTPANLGALVQDVGEMMYRLFMPEQMQRQIAETRCALTITTNDLELPWELMHAQGRFLSLDRPVARMPMGRAMPPADRAAAPRADRLLRFLLIYADPEKNLANAEQEIETVRKYLEQDWKSRIRVDVLAGERATGRRLNEVLRSGSYDVIHYAGHAHFDQESHELSGLYLGKDRDSSEVFFAQKIRRLMAGRPLVFLNACETGVTANEAQGQERVTYFQQPAEGLASAFIYGGALGCIGSLWPVYDKPAAEFAVEFYRHLLEGYMVGEALRATRAEIKDRYPDQIAWASYLYYGDPTAVLAE